MVLKSLLRSPLGSLVLTHYFHYQKLSWFERTVQYSFAVLETPVTGTEVSRELETQTRRNQTLKKTHTHTRAQLYKQNPWTMICMVLVTEERTQSCLQPWSHASMSERSTYEMLSVLSLVIQSNFFSEIKYWNMPPKLFQMRQSVNFEL